MKLRLFGVAVLAATLATVVLAAPSHADPPGTKPVDCATLWQYPTGHSAEVCRSDGWTIHKRLVVDDHDLLRYSRLPSCPFEDGSGPGHRICSWNFPGSDDGNGVGLAYWISGRSTEDSGGRRLVAHYVWTVSPVVHKWHWISAEIADALSEGQFGDWKNIDFTRCVMRPHRVEGKPLHRWQIKCANGATGWSS